MSGAHRGLAPGDAELFAPAKWPALRAAVHDLSWLLGRSYSEVAATKLVGDRYSLAARQRMAVQRSACSDQALARRLAGLAHPREARRARVLVDGFNLLMTLEVALSGGIVLRGRDGNLRDIAGIHGTYRQVEETPPAALLLGEALAALDPSEVTLFLDAPVSNSGRLRAALSALYQGRGWPITVTLDPSPDARLIAADGLVITADGAILERCQRWLLLSPALVAAHAPHAAVIDLAPPPGGSQ